MIAQKYPKRAFIVPNLVNFFFHETFELDKFEGAAFKYDNIVFKF